MGRPKKIYVTTINFGDARHPARLLVDEYIRKNGRQKLSALMRKLVTIYLSEDKNYDHWKVRHKIYELQQLQKEFDRMVTEIKAMKQRLKDDHGYDDDTITELIGGRTR